MNPATIQEYQAEFQQRIQEVQTTIQQIQKAEKQRTKEQYDQWATKFRFAAGDKVYLNVLAHKKGTCKKLEPLFKGP